MAKRYDGIVAKLVEQEKQKKGSDASNGQEGSLVSKLAEQERQRREKEQKQQEAIWRGMDLARAASFGNIQFNRKNALTDDQLMQQAQDTKAFYFQMNQAGAKLGNQKLLDRSNQGFQGANDRLRERIRQNEQDYFHPAPSKAASAPAEDGSNPLISEATEAGKTLQTAPASAKLETTVSQYNKKLENLYRNYQLAEAAEDQQAANRYWAEYQRASQALGDAQKKAVSAYDGKLQTGMHMLPKDWKAKTNQEKADYWQQRYNEGVDAYKVGQMTRDQALMDRAEAYTNWAYSKWESANASVVGEKDGPSAEYALRYTRQELETKKAEAEAAVAARKKDMEDADKVYENYVLGVYKPQNPTEDPEAAYYQAKQSYENAQAEVEVWTKAIELDKGDEFAKLEEWVPSMAVKTNRTTEGASVRGQILKGQAAFRRHEEEAVRKTYGSENPGNQNLSFDQSSDYYKSEYEKAATGYAWDTDNAALFNFGLLKENGYSDALKQNEMGWGMTDEQKETFYFLYAEDPEKAEEFAKACKKKNEDAYYAEKSKPEKNWLKRIGKDVLAANMKLLGGAVPFTKAGQKLTKEANAMVSSVATGREEYGAFNSGYLTGKLPESIPIIGGKGLGDLTQLNSSMIMSGETQAAAKVAMATGHPGAAAVIEVVGLYLQSGAAANEDYIEMRELGWDDGSAIFHAVCAGISEAAFEKLSLDHFVKAGPPKNWKDTVKMLFTQAGVEASEETFTTIANRIADTAIAKWSGDGYDDDRTRRAKEYMAAGMSYQQAYEKADKDMRADLFNDALGGFLSGLLMSGGETALSSGHQGFQRIQSRRAGLQMGNVLSTENLQQYISEYAQKENQLRDAGQTFDAKDVKAYRQGLETSLINRGVDWNGNREESDVQVGDTPLIRQPAGLTPSHQGEGMGGEVAAAQTEQQSPVRQEAREAGIQEGSDLQPTELRNLIEQLTTTELEVRESGDMNAAERITGYREGLEQALRQKAVDWNGNRAQNDGQALLVPTDINGQQVAGTTEKGRQITGPTEQNGGLNDGRIQGRSEIGGSGGQIARAADDGQLSARAAGPADGGQRDAGLGTGRQIGGLGEGTGGSESRGAEAQERAQFFNSVRALDAEKRSSQQIGVRGGTKNQNLIEIPADIQTAGMQQAKAEADANGMRLTFFAGDSIEMRAKDGRIIRADGLYQIDTDGVPHEYIRADSKRYTPEQLSRHEDTHAILAANRGLLQDMADALFEEKGEAGVARMVDAYVTAMDGCYGVYQEGMTEDEQRDLAMLYIEEMFADWRAGMNRGGSEARKAREAAGGVAQRFAGDIENARQNRAGIDRRNGPGTRLAFAGQNAETADAAALDEAKQLLAEGTDSETIRKQTGWFRGMDDKWRFEIDDSGMEFRRQGDMQSMRDPEYREYLELWDKVVARLEGNEADMERLRELDKRFSGVGQVQAYKLRNGTATLPDIIRHDALFEAYPGLRDVRVQFANLEPGVNASFDQKSNTVKVSYSLQNEPEGTLIHEIQHAIQGIEGFAKGSSNGYWAKQIRAERERSVEEAKEEVRRLFDAMPEELQESVRAYNRAISDRDYDLANRIEDQLYADGYGDTFSEYMDAQTFLDLERRRQNENPVGDESMDLYIRTAGEIEARDTARRRELSAEQRKNTRPDIDREDVVFAGQGTESFEIRYPQFTDQDIRENSIALQRMGIVKELTGNEFPKGSVKFADQIRQFFNSLGNNVYSERFGDVALVNSSVRSDIKHGLTPVKNAAYAAIPEVIQNGTVIYTIDKGHGTERIVVAAPILIGGKKYYMGVMLQRDQKSQRLYLHDVATEEELNASSGEHLNPTGSTEENNELSTTNILRNAINVKENPEDAVDWAGNQETMYSPAEDEDEDGDWIGNREEDGGQSKEPAVTETDAPHPSPAATPSPKGEGSGGQVARATDEAQALAREKKVSIAEKASIEGLKSRIESAEKRLGAYKILQQEGMMTDEIRAQMRDVQESLEIFRKALDGKKAQRTAAKEAEKNDKALKAQRKQERAAKKKALAKEAELADNKPRQARKEFRQDALNLFGVQAAKRQALGNILNSFADKLLAQGSVSETDRAELFRQLYDAGVEVVQADDYHREIRNAVDSGRIYVPESVRAEFGDDWKAFREKAWGNRIYLTNDINDRGADSWNAELAELFPGSFDAEETDARNMLENIVDLAEEGKAEHMSLADMMRRNQNETGFTVDQQMDELEQKVDHLIDTFAQKAELEQKVKKAGVMQLVKERQKNRELAAKQTQRKRENETRSQVMKQLQALNKMRKKSAPEIQKQIDSIIGNLDTMARSISPAGLEDLQALSRKYMEAAEDPNFLGNPYVEARIARLNQVQLDDLEISDVIELGRTISALVKTVTDDKKLLTDARNKEVSEAASMAAKEIQSSEGSKGGKLRDFLGNEHLSPTREIQRLGGWVRGGQMEQLSRALEDGGTRRMDYQRQATRIFDKFLADKANQKWLQTAQGKDAQWIKLTVPAGITAQDGSLKIENVSFEITPMMRVGLLMHSRNVDNLRHIETGGIVIPNKEYYRKGDLANADAKGTRVKLRPETVRAIVRDCTAQERAFAGLLEQYYDGLSKEKINEVSMQIDGFERAGGDHYYGIKVSRKFLAAQPEQIQRNLALDSIGSIVNERVHAGNPIILEDASKALEDHIDLISKYYGYTAAIRDFNAVMNYNFHESAKDGGTANAYAGSVKEILQDKWGSGAQKYLDKLLGDLQQSSGIKETAAQFLAKLRGNLAGASLMFNPAVALSQTASLPGAMQTLGLDGIVAALKPEKVDMGLIEKYSPVLWYRNQGNSTQELGDYMKEQGLEGKLPFFFNWIQKMDSWTIRRIWAGAEYRVSKDTDLSPGSKAEIDAGTDPYYQEVARVFQRAVYDTQPNYSEMQRPAILRSESDLTKMLTMFKTVPLQYYNMMYEAAGRLRADKARLKQDASAENKANYEQSKSFAAKTFVGVLSANVVYVVMKALIKGTIGGKKKKYLDDEGDLDAGKIFGGLGKDLLDTYAGSVIGGNELLSFIEKQIEGGNYYNRGVFDVSVVSSLNQTIARFQDVRNEIVNADYWGARGKIKEFAKQLAMDAGIPANNIETYLLGTMKWIAPEWVDRYENFFDEFERADLKGEHGRDLRAAIRVLMDNRTDGLKDETIDEIMRLWENGQNAAIPSAIPSKVSIEGEDVEIKGADRSAFRERWGQVIGESLEKLLASDAYETADDKGKAKLIAKLYDYARQQAAAAVTERKLDAWVEFGKACEAAGIPLTDYLTVASVDKGKLKDMDGEALDSAIRSLMEFRVGDLDEKTLDELGRLFANGANGAIPSDVPTSVSVSGEDRTLTPEERVAWLQAWKRIAGEGLEGLISSGAYKTADDAGKAKMLSALYDMARASASSEVVNGYSPDKWVSVGMEAAERGVPIDEYASFHVGMSGLKTAEKLALLKGQSWSDNQKEFIWTELMATDTQYSKYQNLKNAGMKWADAMEQLGIGAASTTPSGLTDAQQAQYDKYWNEISGPATQQLLNNADYKKADKASQAAFLDRLNDYAARVAKAKVLSGYDKGKWVECGERLVTSGVKLDDYIVYYSSTSDAKSRDKYAALTKTNWTDTQKLIAMEYISQSTYNAAKVGKTYQVELRWYLDGLSKADTDQSGGISQAEAETFLDGISSLGREDKAYLWQMLCSSSKWKNNPYGPNFGEEIWHDLHPDD